MGSLVGGGRLFFNGSGQVPASPTPLHFSSPWSARTQGECSPGLLSTRTHSRSRTHLRRSQLVTPEASWNKTTKSYFKTSILCEYQQGSGRAAKRVGCLQLQARGLTFASRLLSLAWLMLTFSFGFRFPEHTNLDLSSGQFWMLGSATF
jgi:hypothetical protein